jgi:hypothetical protein
MAKTSGKLMFVNPLPRRRFHRFVFLAAGIYNIAWGSHSILSTPGRHIGKKFSVTENE